MANYLFCMLIISFFTNIVNGCPTECTCRGDLVDCSNKNLRNPPKRYPDDTHIVNLNQNRITVLGPRSFQRQSTLEIMKISGNNIRVIRAYAFRPFSNLLTLDLSNNQIVKIYGRGLKGINKVRTLSLSNNRLRSVTRIFMATPNLFQLNLGFNQLRRLGEGDFATNSDLHYLDLRNNKISTIHRNTFKNLRKLRTLFLNNNPLVNLPAELKFGSDVLQLLDFSSCQLTSIPKGLPSSIEDLRFGQNRITRINQSDLANVTELKMITFNDNQIEIFEYFAIGNALNLQEVWLRGNKLVYIPRGLPDSVKKIHMHSNMVHQIEGRLFSENSQLEYLDVSNNHVSNISTEAFTDLMKLETLNFEGNHIHDLKPGTFVNLVTLKSLLLGNNPIETVQSGAFRNLPNLTTLTLNYNPIEDVEINDNFLLEMPMLEKLNLMASIGMAKSLINLMENSHFVIEKVSEVILTYNNLRKLSPSFRDTFPNIKKLPLDGNAWICNHELLWLKQWMASTIEEITFHEYSPPKCETPFGLAGSDIVDVRDSDFRHHDENLLNDFPYLIVEEEFMKKEDEKEKLHRLDKEKKKKNSSEKSNYKEPKKFSSKKKMADFDEPVKAAKLSNIKNEYLKERKKSMKKAPKTGSVKDKYGFEDKRNRMKEKSKFDENTNIINYKHEKPVHKPTIYKENSNQEKEKVSQSKDSLTNAEKVEQKLRNMKNGKENNADMDKKNYQTELLKNRGDNNFAKNKIIKKDNSHKEMMKKDNSHKETKEKYFDEDEERTPKKNHRQIKDFRIKKENKKTSEKENKMQTKDDSTKDILNGKEDKSKASGVLKKSQSIVPESNDQKTKLKKQKLKSDKHKDEQHTAMMTKDGINKTAPKSIPKPPKRKNKNGKKHSHKKRRKCERKGKKCRKRRNRNGKRERKNRKPRNEKSQQKL